MRSLIHDRPEGRYFASGSERQIWERYCGFLDLSIGQFMDIQSYLLQEQIRLVADTPIGKSIMRGTKPKSVDEFRKSVPITSYEDFAPFIGERQESALAEKPYFWCHSAGRGGNFKWIPYTKSAFERISKHAVALGILSAAGRKGEVKLDPGAKMLVNLAPRPYASGSLLHHFAEYFPYKPIPPLSEAESLDFRERTKLAFKLALDQGIDYIFSVSTVLVKIGESFANEERNSKLSSSLVRPGALNRLARGWLRSRFSGRSMLPRDIWMPKGIVTFGVDTAIYEDEITRMWGRVPYQVYGTTETGIGAMQAWNKKALTFVPDVAFWEFIPQEEWRKSKQDPAYQPKTVLMDELEAGQQYELVYTHFHGMPLMRYRIGDVVRVVATEDAETGIKLPQVIFQARASEIIDLAGLTQLDERTVWKAIANTGVPYEDWCAKKEYRDGVGYLRVFLEMKEQHDPERVEDLLETQLRTVDVDYRDLEGWLGQRRAVAVTPMAPGTFARFSEERIKEGVSVARIKPPHINPSESAVEHLLELSDMCWNGAKPANHRNGKNGNGRHP